MSLSNPPSRHRRTRRGNTLGMVLVAIVSVSLIGTGLLSLASVNGQEAARKLSRQHAFWVAEAGLEEAKAIARKVRNTSNPTELFPEGSRSWTGSTTLGSYAVEVTELGGAKSGAKAPAYQVTSQAVSNGGRGAALAIDLLQTAPMEIGIFGKQYCEIAAHKVVFSYHSSVWTDPVPADSTGEAVVGSSHHIHMGACAWIDGWIQPGSDIYGTAADCSGCSGITQADPVQINPDPLGINYGPAWLALEDVKVNNQNDTVAEIVDNVLTVSNNQTVTIEPGSYYLAGITLQSRGTLILNTITNAKVRIYLEGNFTAAHSDSEIVNLSGRPGDFQLYARSGTVLIQSKNDYKGFLYAPNSSVNMAPTQDFNGTIWANYTVVRPNKKIYIDLDALDYGVTDIYGINVLNWREIAPAGL